MKDINVTTQTCRTTREPELKYTKSGMAILHFSYAVNYSVKQDDEYVERASFFDAEYFGKAAEAVAKFIGKGTALVIEGEYRQDRWEQDGQPRQKVKMIVNSLRIMDFHKDKPQETTQEGQGEAHVGQVASVFQKAQENAGAKGGAGKDKASGELIKASDQFDDDIPF